MINTSAETTRHTIKCEIKLAQGRIAKISTSVASSPGRDTCFERDRPRVYVMMRGDKSIVMLYMNSFALLVRHRGLASRRAGSAHPDVVRGGLSFHVGSAAIRRSSDTCKRRLRHDSENSSRKMLWRTKNGENFLKKFRRISRRRFYTRQ